MTYWKIRILKIRLLFMNWKHEFKIRILKIYNFFRKQYSVFWLNFSKLVLPRKHFKNKMIILYAVKGAHSSRLNRPDLSLHSLPKDNSYKAKWLDYVSGNKDSPKIELPHAFATFRVKPFSKRFKGGLSGQMTWQFLNV